MCTDHFGSTAESRRPQFCNSQPWTLIPKASKQKSFCLLYFFLLFTNFTKKRKIYFQVTFENYGAAVT